MTWQWVIVILGLAWSLIGLAALVGWQSQKEGSFWNRPPADKELAAAIQTSLEAADEATTSLANLEERWNERYGVPLERTQKAVSTLAWWLVAAQSGLGQKDAEGINQILDGTYVDKTATDTLVREPDVKVPGM